MVEPYLRRSPLAHSGLAARAAEAPAEARIVSLGESPHRCQINLRGNADDDRLHGSASPASSASSFP